LWGRDLRVLEKVAADLFAVKEARWKPTVQRKPLRRESQLRNVGRLPRRMNSTIPAVRRQGSRCPRDRSRVLCVSQCARKNSNSYHDDGNRLETKLGQSEASTLSPRTMKSNSAPRQGKARAISCSTAVPVTLVRASCLSDAPLSTLRRRAYPVKSIGSKRTNRGARLSHSLDLGRKDTRLRRRPLQELPWFYCVDGDWR